MFVIWLKSKNSDNWIVWCRVQRFWPAYAYAECRFWLNRGRIAFVEKL